MPAGGTWIAQNKRRPGAYINFVSVPRTVGVLGERGTVACLLPMSWGPEGEVITLTGEDLMNGNSVAKVGVDFSDTEGSLIYRACLAGCYTALLCRLNTGGNKASTTLGSGTTTIQAKYPGTVGNSIKIVISSVQDSDSVTLDVLVNNLAKEKFTISAVSELSTIDSDFITITVTGTPDLEDLLTSGVTLDGGTNGSTAASLSTYADKLKNKRFQSIAMYGASTEASVQLSNLVKMWHENYGKDVVAVVYNYTSSDYEGVISVDQGFKTTTETIPVELFPIYVASLTAGAQVNESLTCAVVEDAVEIINPIDEAEIVQALEAGRFILTYRQDGAVCIEQDINSLHNFTVDKNYAFSKNRVVRVLYQLSNDISLIFNRNYAGKVDNDDNGRNTFKMEIIALIDQLVNLGAITNFDGATDITVLQGQSVDSVVVDLTIQPVDAMEKLYMTINVNA